ncbi:MAG: septum formation inhibitor Maf, partial [Alphaproteobacteria bacterium]|nr:septum formation inhibitor Maf [Alphaproteobacteria bacterium]
QDIFILAADTVVCVGRRILEKTDDEAQARHYLSLLSGRAHRVWTGVCVSYNGRNVSRLCETRVRFKVLGAGDIDTYIASAQWRGKAGAYAIQGLAARYITNIVGSYSNVVGLPLYETANLLSGLGYKG